MEKRYYVQVIAENYLKNVIDDPVSPKVHGKYLHGLDQEEFREGFLALLSLVRSLYSDIARDPERFGMMLKDIVEDDPKNTDYTNSNASFLRMPNLLLVLGASAELQPDMSLAIRGDVLMSAAKALKITAVPLLLSKLKEYGFEIIGLGKTIKAEDVISVASIDSRTLPVALKAMAEALLEMNKGDLKKSKQFFYMMHNRLLANGTAKAPTLTVDSFYHALDPANRAFAAALHGTVSDETKQAVRMGGFMRNDWSCVYTGIKSKKVLMSLQINQENLSVKLNLQHIGQYMPLVAELPEKMRDSVRAGGWECGRCNSGCAGGFAFEMDGKAYNKCRCGSFVFADLAKEDAIHCQKLLTKELQFTAADNQ